jgi:hypothetical protein
MDLNSPTLKLGSRNRGSRQVNIKTEGFVITPFAKEYGTGYDDDNGNNTIRRYNDSEIVDDKIYGGIDNNGTFYLDYGKNLKGKNLQMADFREMDVTGIAKDKKGRYIYGDATDNKKVARTAKAFDTQGNPTIDLNLLIPKKNIKAGHESFGQIGGGRYILATSDLKKKVLVAGSLKNIDQYIEDFKKNTGSKVVKLIPLDNGTFARGLSTTDGVITDQDQQNYDNFNNKGGAAFYIQQKMKGGPILPKAQFYNSIIGSQPYRDFATNVANFNLAGQFAGQAANQAIENSQSKEEEKPRYLFGKLGEKLDKSGASGLVNLAGAANQALAFGNMLGANARYNQFEENYQSSLRDKQFTDPMMPQENVNFRGDYVTNTGAPRPDSYTVNKGMYTSNRPGANMFAEGGVIDSELVMPQSEFSPLLTPQQPNAEQKVQQPEKSYKHAGANPIAEKTWGELSNQYSGVKFLGIWGDKSHQKRKSDHNDGNALDVGILDLEQGEKIANQLITEADQKQVKYIIFNKKIWSPDGGWKSYTGSNPHRSHVHVSFFPYEGQKNIKKSGESIAISHNNPGNIMYSPFSSQWGAEKGTYTGKINIAKFKSIEDGWEAFNELLFGSQSKYLNETIESGRNKYVTGNSKTQTDSSKFIAKELGIDGNMRMGDLDENKRKKLLELYVKYEDNRMHRKLKEMGYFKEGGQVGYTEGEEYDLTEDEINEILKNGGEIDFI